MCLLSVNDENLEMLKVVPYTAYTKQGQNSCLEFTTKPYQIRLDASKMFFFCNLGIYLLPVRPKKYGLEAIFMPTTVNRWVTDISCQLL